MTDKKGRQTTNSRGGKGLVEGSGSKTRDKKKKTLTTEPTLTLGGGLAFISSEGYTSGGDGAARGLGQHFDAVLVLPLRNYL